MEIDIEKLRNHLLDYYGTAIYSGMPMACINVAKVEACSVEELLRIAQKERIDLSEFTVNKGLF